MLEHFSTRLKNWDNTDKAFVIRPFSIEFVDDLENSRDCTTSQQKAAIKKCLLKKSPSITGTYFTSHKYRCMYIGLHGSYRLLFLMYVTFIHADMQQYILWESLNFDGIRREIFPDTRWEITNFRACTVTLFVTIISYLLFNCETLISFVHFLITNNWSICVKSILIIKRHFFLQKKLWIKE